MTTEPISRKNKSEKIADHILEQIANGTWPGGSKLPSEMELADRFGVSRISIRQAISQLTGQGILNVVQGGGTYVNKVLPKDYLSNVLQMVVMDEPDYLEIQEFRLYLEPIIAFYAAVKASPEALEQLKGCVERQEEAEHDGDMQVYLEEDILFHNLIAESVRNSVVSKIMSLVRDLLDLAMQHSAQITGYEDGVQYHRKVYEQLKNRDSEGARATMWCHIQNNIVVYKKMNP